MTSPRILVLSASVGGGHVSAARAVTLALQQTAPDATVLNVDVLEKCTSAFRRVYGRTYLDLVNAAPHLLGYLYDVSDRPRDGSMRRHTGDGWQEGRRSGVDLHAQKAEGNLMPGMLTVADVASRLNVAESTIYDLVAAKRLPCHRIGRKRGTIRFTEGQVEAYLATTLLPAAEATPPSSSAP